ncbi:MAG: hypothetical protein ACWA5L_08330 [bacterium]
MIHKFLLPCLLAVTFSACAGTVPSPQAASSADIFFARLSALCGKSFAGRVTSTDPQDAQWAKERMVIHITDCTTDRIRVPLHVGDNHSRSWIITRANSSLSLAHDHRHEDGSPTTVTMYGGDARKPGSVQRQEFPANPFSKTLFRQAGLEVSTANVWAIEIKPANYLAYELRRPDRFFRAEFDLSQEVATPPAAWGYEE